MACASCLAGCEVFRADILTAPNPLRFQALAKEFGAVNSPQTASREVLAHIVFDAAKASCQVERESVQLVALAESASASELVLSLHCPHTKSIISIHNCQFSEH